MFNYAFWLIPWSTEIVVGEDGHLGQEPSLDKPTMFCQFFVLNKLVVMRSQHLLPFLPRNCLKFWKIRGVFSTHTCLYRDTFRAAATQGNFCGPVP